MKNNLIPAEIIESELITNCDRFKILIHSDFCHCEAESSARVNNLSYEAIFQHSINAFCCLLEDCFATKFKNYFKVSWLAMTWYYLNDW